MKTCTVDGCSRKHRARGLCGAHYNQRHRPPRRKVQVPCTECGSTCEKYAEDIKKGPNPFCSLRCRDAYGRTHGLGAYRPRPEKPVRPRVPRDDRSPLRRAYEDGDHAGLIAAIRAFCDVRPDGCWEWQRSLSRDGYPLVRIARRDYGVHRLVVEAKYGKPLGKQAAHHVCANTFCVSPQHLQPVTARENAAEMLARTYLTNRISELESALEALAPEHPLLQEIGVAAA